MKKEETVGIGIIGCGTRVRDLIKDTISGAERLKVVALCDPDERAITKTMELCNCPDARRYSDYHALVSDPGVQWVAIGSINAVHKDHVLAALGAGRHVFCEKPLATTIEDCAELARAVRKSKSIFSMGFVLRYSRFYKRIKALLEMGEIGDLISFEFNEILGFNHGGFIMSDWRRLRSMGGTHLLEKCCHDFDLANWLAGSIPVRAASFGGLNFFVPGNRRHIERIGTNKNGKKAYMTWTDYSFYRDERAPDPFSSDKDIVDNQVVILEYANGVRASFHTNLNAALCERRFYLIGTEGTLIGDVLTGEIKRQRIGFDTVPVIEKSDGGGHGGADGFIAESLRRSMLEGSAPEVGLIDGIKSAVAVLGCDKALDNGAVCDLKPMWKSVGIDPR